MRESCERIANVLGISGGSQILSPINIIPNTSTNPNLNYPSSTQNRVRTPTDFLSPKR